MARVIGQSFGHRIGRFHRAAGKLDVQTREQRGFIRRRAYGQGLTGTKRHIPSRGRRQADHRPAANRAQLGHGGCVYRAEVRTIAEEDTHLAIRPPDRVEKNQPIDPPRAKAAPDHVGPRR
jgi:hypothetical protein